MSKSKNTPPAAPAHHWPNPAEYSELLQRIAQHSQALMQDFLARNKSAHVTLAKPDSAHIGQAFMEFTSRLLANPVRLMGAQMSLWQDYARLWQSTLTRMSGGQPEPIAAPAAGDKRFQDEAWQNIWLFDYIKQSYLLSARWAQGLVKGVEGMDPKTARKVDFYARQMVDAIAPSNFWLTNPEVLRTTVETGGENLIKGFERLLADLERGEGQLAISMTERTAFRVGETLAITKGKVIFQNEMMQLIQYEPLTHQVNRTPLLILPPWINKYYILDLREKNSLIRWLVEQGHTVFCISWANPDGTFRNINFDDYMASGLFPAMREVARATGENKVNVVGYCIGGTLLASSLAYLKSANKKDIQGLPEIASATYFVALTDFTDPGEIGVFIDEDQLVALESKMNEKGFLDARSMHVTFNLLRSNDLIWSFVVNNYLLGKEPFPFDILYWTSDTTNLPAAMHSFYLRKMYLENKLVQPYGIGMKNVPIDLRNITTPSFMISAQEDHIAPWRSTYAATQLYKGPITFVLAGSGHIAGVVNHPANNKYGYWTNPKCPPHPDDWLKDAVYRPGSWWPAWMEWLKLYTGDTVPAREPGANGTAIEEAPGSYVRVRAI
jgi:polyhydroxyalkanoate synthase subunit PhaC